MHDFISTVRIAELEFEYRITISILISTELKLNEISFFVD